MIACPRDPDVCLRRDTESLLRDSEIGMGNLGVVRRFVLTQVFFPKNSDRRKAQV